MRLLKFSHHLLQFHSLCHYLFLDYSDIGELRRILHLNSRQLLSKLFVLTLHALELLSKLGDFRLPSFLLGPNLLAQILCLPGKRGQLLALQLSITLALLLLQVHISTLPPLRALGLIWQCTRHLTTIRLPSLGCAARLLPAHWRL
jgi:hypothetical protein